MLDCSDMKADDIFELVHAQPFAPFEVHLVDGRSFVIEHPDFIMRTRDNLTLHISADDRTHRVDTKLVLSVTENSARRPSRRKRQEKK